MISYLEGFRDGRPWADMVEVIGPDPVDLIMTDLTGWAVSTPVDLGRQLLDKGARLSRHAHTMHCDLTDLSALPPLEGPAPEGFRFIPAHERTAEDMFESWVAAFPPGHPDHSATRDDQQAFLEELVPLVAGKLIGELLPCSAVALDTDGDVVAGVLVNGFKGTPWISEVFRHPERSPRGLGAHLLRHVQLRAAAGGLTEMGLAVTYANHAKNTYARIGFTITSTSMTVII
ncbi:GNAT family N-acetyltransferase [Acrocarpospora catenulata]|uniref:GNAT family N-acetyltransferase n=1 Tax=Acrocarpospora catenulata TaxID=2836182 RepID=UPI001BD9C54B|nr:GNAT family N-acetyltransferase [Acrocarpospora catenulata]